MTFELQDAKTKCLDVRVLSRKDRKPDEPAGAQLLLAATLSAGVLAMFDGFLPGMLFRKSSGAKQAAIDGMEGDELTTIGDHVKRLGWVYEQTGVSVEIDLGLGGPSNLQLEDCKAHRVSFAPKQGGSVLVQWTIDAPALSDATRGRLTGLKSTEIQLTMRGPEVDGAQQEIEPPAKKSAKAKRGGEEGTWPFPKGGAAAKGDDPVLAAAKEAHGIKDAA